MKIEHFKIVSRFDDWRFSFIPQIFGLVYFWLFLFAYELHFETIKIVVFSFVTSLGFASLGYLINEFFDQKSDALAGKKNHILNASISQKLIFFLISISLTFAPWFILPNNTITWVLISLQLVFYLLYNAPPFRLKNHSFWSVFLDASYAYLIPFLLSCNTYALGAKSSQLSLGILLLFASILFIVGLKNIFIHLINDHFFDKQHDRLSLPRIFGVKRSKVFLTTLSSIEYLLLITFSILLSFRSLLFLCLLGMVIYSFAKMAIHLKKDNKYFILDSSFCLSSNAIYQRYFPIICLVILCIESPLWSVLVPLHLLTLTPRSYINRFKDLLTNNILIFTKVAYRYIRKLFSKIVNYSIYFLFRLGGVNLKKEQKSALEFLRNHK
jgi:1,4-dihydroxy-2-naphthoate octaprenyltransferase